MHTRAAMAVVAVVIMGGPAHAQELQRLSLDDAAALRTVIATDTQVKAEGAGSIKITTAWPTVVCLGETGALDVENAQLIYAANVKSELEGSAFLEMWVYVGDGHYFSKGLNDMVMNTSDWKTIKTPFIFQKGQKPSKVVLNLVVNGKGTVWVDDVVLSKEPLK
ncbi:MAG: hypothetical protein NC924_03590 [Candidatus Omnitrophica bacterium]|nr:hypothetical protein [Candidatus Omnitrophota bacterium]